MKNLTSQSHTPLRVALLAGGTSGERDVSLLSADGARAALLEAGFEVTQLDPANTDDLKALIDGSKAHDFDVAFICLHGKGGEDGTVQGFLELLGLPYTGSGVLASARAIDKAAAKMIYRTFSIPTAAWSVVSRADFADMTPEDAADIARALGGKCIVKAACEGSTIGCFVANAPEDAYDCLRRALDYDKTALIESFIEGREFTVAVLGNDEPHALPVIEINVHTSFYDYTTKYSPNGATHLCPAPLTDSQTREISLLAVKAHRALGCRGVSRSDFLLSDEGDFIILETNTIPGMTPVSLLPDAARAAGVEFPELVTMLVSLALN